MKQNGLNTGHAFAVAACKDIGFLCVHVYLYTHAFSEPFKAKGFTAFQRNPLSALLGNVLALYSGAEFFPVLMYNVTPYICKNIMIILLMNFFLSDSTT